MLNAIASSLVSLPLAWYTAARPKTNRMLDLPSHAGVFESRFGAKAGTDGTGFFIDDDGTGYVAFAANPPGTGPPLLLLVELLLFYFDLA